MDNVSLDSLLNDPRKRQYWLKPIGWPKDHPLWDAIETRSWTERQIEINFHDSPALISPDDIVIAYRIRIKRLLYVAQRLPMDQWEEKVKRTPYEVDRWPEYIKARNLTPEYAAVWKKHSFNPWPLARAYNKLHPNEPVRLGGILSGNDKAKISQGFAEVLIRLIRRA